MLWMRTRRPCHWAVLKFSRIHPFVGSFLVDLRLENNLVYGASTSIKEVVHRSNLLLTCISMEPYSKGLAMHIVRGSEISRLDEAEVNPFYIHVLSSSKQFLFCNPNPSRAESQNCFHFFIVIFTTTLYFLLYQFLFLNEPSTQIAKLFVTSTMVHE